MTRRRIFLVIAALVIGAVAVSLYRGREPRYEGKSLTDWLGGYISGGSMIYVGPSPEIDVAIRQIGTNAIPFLLPMLRTRDSKMKAWLSNEIDKHRIVQIKNRWKWYAYFSAGTAAEAFGALGASASNAVPQLIKTYRDNINQDSQRSCIRALGLIGPAASQAIPICLSEVANQDKGMRRTAIEALVNLRLEHKLLIPILIDGLHDSYGGVRYFCAGVLAELGPEAKPAVPDLTNLLQDTNPYVVTNASKALKAIDPEAAAKAGAK